MDIRPFGPDDTEDLQASVDLHNALVAHESPWAHPSTLVQMERMYRHGWDGEPFVPFLGVEAGTPVAVAAYSVSDYDNPHLAWTDLEVHPDHRRRGHGTAMLEMLRDTVLGLGRSSLAGAAWELDGTAAFATHHGFTARAVEVNRRQLIAEVDWDEVERLRAEAWRAAADYELVRYPGRTPDAELPALAELTAAINDAPTDDLDIEDEVFSPERIRAYETAQLASGAGFHRLVARHRTSGQLAGQSVVVVEPDRPHLAEQHDTSVVRAHRGHRLGLLLKAEMLGWLRETRPEVASIDTWNAASNSHMIAVNEALGYRVVHQAVNYQRDA